METYQVGVSELDEYGLRHLRENHPDAIYVVYDYEHPDYEGWGQAVVKTPDGFWSINLGHCSCYGPTDEMGTKTTLEEILNSDSIHDTDVAKNIRAKIAELESVAVEV